ncbi:MAG TPA: phage major capsid protein [Acidimicrobiales bacterium]|jgi:HK97 family phage major capsid protein
MSETDTRPTLTYKQICGRLDDIGDHLERLNVRAEKEGSLLDEDEKRWGELTAEFDELTAEKRRLERQADLLRVKRERVSATAARGGRTERGSDDFDADPLGEPDSIEEGRFNNPWDISEMRMGLTPTARGAELRARAKSAIEKMQGTTDRRREGATQIIERWDNEKGELSELVLATSSPAYLRAFTKLARSQGRSEVLNEEERAAVDRAMSLTDAAGGFLVPFQLDPTVIITSDGSFNQVRQIARTVVATGDVWNGVSAGAVSWSYDAEAAEVSDDTPTFAQPSITIRTARGFVPISLEAYMDAANVADEVGRLLAQGREDLESQVFVTGVAASNQPVGVLSAISATDGGSPDRTVDSTTTDTFAIGDLYRLYNALPARYRARASWLSNNSIYSLARQFDTQGGAGLWATLGQDRPDGLIGKPVYEAEAMDGTITAASDNYVLLFGDFSNYVIADRVGMTVEFIPHLMGANRRPTGQRGWFAYYRNGADVVNTAAFRLLNVT